MKKEDLDEDVDEALTDKHDDEMAAAGLVKSSRKILTTSFRRLFLQKARKKVTEAQLREAIQRSLSDTFLSEINHV